MTSRLRQTTRWLCGILLLCVPVWPVISGETGDEPAPLRVYTNADLKRFPLPADSVTVELADPAEGWEFVASYLDREHGRIDAERAFELERARVEAEQTRLTTGYASIPYAPRYYGYAYDGRRDKAHRKQPRHGRPTPYGLAGPMRFEGARPLHAGPTRAQLHRAHAIRHKGSDAFPTRP